MGVSRSMISAFRGGRTNIAARQQAQRLENGKGRFQRDVAASPLETIHGRPAHAREHCQLLLREALPFAPSYRFFDKT